MERGYYSALLRQVPPGDLARAAVRRAVRTARNVVARSPLETAAALEARWGAAGPQALAQRVLSPRRSWADVARRASVLEALKRVPGGAERALERARRVCEGTFLLFGREVSFGRGRPIDWSLDPVSGYRYPLLPVAEMPGLAPGRDPKLPWALGRLDGLIALGQGYWVAPERERRAFAQAFVHQAQDFLQENPTGVGIHWTCPMEVSLRAANLAQALLMFRDAKEVQAPGFLARVTRALGAHLGFVEQNLEDQGAVPNNHLLADLLGQWVVGLLFPELPDAPRLAAAARARFCDALARQVHPDGCSFEGSVPYHRLVLEMATVAHALGALNGLPLVGDGRERLLRMFEAARAWCSEGGLVPQLGDNDSGRVLAFVDRPSLDHGYLAPLGAALLGAPSLKDAEASFPDEAAWLLGMPGLLRYEALAATPRPLGFSSRLGGVHVLRSGPAVLTVSAGPSGQGGVGGHSHNDKLSFELHLSGVPVVVDPGTGTYSADPALRHALRSTAAHNTLQVDGAEQSPLDPGRPFALVDAANAQVTAFYRRSPLARLSARHEGFGRPGAPLTVERTFLLDEALGSLSLEDRVEGTGEHRLRFCLHLPDREARLREASPEELRRGRRAPGGPMRLSQVGVELGPRERPRALVLFADDVAPRLEPAVYSPGYGELREALQVAWESARALPARESCVVLFLNRSGEGG